MELVLVVVILGIIAGFVIPNFETTIERAHSNDAKANLRAIHSANRIYYAEKNSYWPETAGSYNLAAINSALRLSIYANGMGYTCAPGITLGTTYQCDAERNDWALRITEAYPTTAITCIAGTCP